MPRISIRELEIIDAISTEGTLRGAARKLYISQPPLSRALGALEKKVGADLFVRTSKGMLPTSEGAELASHARYILERVEIAEQAVQDVSAGGSGHLSIGYTDDFQNGVFPMRLVRLMKQFPKLQVLLEQDYTPHIATKVANGQLDAGLLCPPIPPHLTNLRIDHIDRVDMFLMAASTDPVADLQMVETSYLEGKTLVVGSLKPESGFYIQIMQGIQRARLNVDVIEGIYPTTMIANLVATGMGYSIVTADSVDGTRADVTLVPFADHGFTLERAMVSGRGPIGPTVRAFREAMLADSASPDCDDDTKKVSDTNKMVL
ncbi:MAG: LysR family transcriptional regulator [Pseudomonadales bacterium]